MPTSRPQVRGTFVLVITVSPIFRSISYYRRRASFAGLAARLAPPGLMFGIHFSPLGDMGAEHRHQSLGLACERGIEDLLVLAPRLIAREILHPECQHTIAQALIIHHAMEVQQPPRV